MKPNRRNPLFATFFRGNTLATAIVISLIGLTTADPSMAADAYWDSNGASAGAGTTPTGTWGTSTFWSSDSTGATATGAWSAGNVAIFSAGTDAVNAYTVTLVVSELNPADSAAVQAAITPTLPALDADWEWHSFRTDGSAPADSSDFIRLQVEEAP